MRIRAPRAMRPFGAATLRKADTRAREMDKALKRAGSRCELCPVTGVDRQTHHVFMRGHVAGIPSVHCESAECLLVLCVTDPSRGHVGCHNRIHDGDVELIRRAQMKALYRFTGRWGVDLAELLREAGPDLVDVMRACCRELESR